MVRRYVLVVMALTISVVLAAESLPSSDTSSSASASSSTSNNKAAQPHYEPLRSQDRPDEYYGNYQALDDLHSNYPKRNQGHLNSRLSSKSTLDRADYYADTHSSYDKSSVRDSSDRRNPSASRSRPKATNRNSYYNQYSYEDSQSNQESQESDAPSSLKRAGTSYNYDRYYSDYSAAYGPSYSASVYGSSYTPNRKTFTGGSNPLALLVAPLAGIAFLAAAAALAVSPAYLTISASTISGRKRRDLLTMIDPAVADKITPELMQKIQELQTLEKFMSSIPKERNYQQQIMSMYLSCSGYTEESNVCLDRVFCEYGNPNSKLTTEERDVLSIVLYNIMANNFVQDDYKNRLRSAARYGRDALQCNKYDCPALNNPNKAN